MEAYLQVQVRGVKHRLGGGIDREFVVVALGEGGRCGKGEGDKKGKNCLCGANSPDEHNSRFFFCLNRVEALLPFVAAKLQ